jgi:hypothetical protein
MDRIVEDADWREFETRGMCALAFPQSPPAPTHLTP